MSMIFHCPSCGAEASLDVIIAHEETRLLMFDVLTASLPLGAQVDRYLRLFKPAKQVLRVDRVRKLLDALVPDIRRRAIQRKGREWRVEVETWKQGIDVVLDAHHKGKLDTPLTDHAYLYEVLMRMVDKHEAQQERQSESARHGRTHTEGSQSVSEVMANMDRAVERAGRAVEALAASRPAPPPPTGPGLYARRVKAQQEAARREREEAAQRQHDRGGHDA